MKTHPETGEIRKMLRLAIGTRSQLCQVADGFKVIVVVEQRHAYDKLDLPLLNRFEKQLLCAEQVASAQQQLVVDELTEWISTVADEAGVGSLQDLFCGHHSGNNSLFIYLCVPVCLCL